MSKKPNKPANSPLLQLGRAVEWPHTPEQAQIDGVPNPQNDTDYLVRFTVPEFTSICPVTGQPDFAHLMIDYVPGRWLLESKSLKLYVASFRNHGAFHEDCTVMIGKRIAAAIKPKWLRIGGYWYPRGGHAFAEREDDSVTHQQVAAGDRAGRVHADERAGMEEAAAQAGASLR
jgi:7-cyano-7-deazaguanine reductase